MMPTAKPQSRGSSRRTRWWFASGNSWPNAAAGAGTASDLLRAATALAGDDVSKKSAGWPINPGALAGRLRRAQTFLRVLGIEISFTREGRAGTRTIRIAGEIPYDLLRFQSVLANSSPDKRSGAAQCDCSSLGSAGQLEIRGSVSISSGLRTGHWSIHTHRCRANSAAWIQISFRAAGFAGPPDGIIVLAGAGDAGIDAVSALSRDYPTARLTFSGFSATALKRFARLGGDPARVYVESRPRTTSEDALYSAALLKPKPGERWLLVTLASHMPRAVGCFRVAVSGTI